LHAALDFDDVRAGQAAADPPPALKPFGFVQLVILAMLVHRVQSSPRLDRNRDEGDESKCDEEAKARMYASTVASVNQRLRRTSSLRPFSKQLRSLGSLHLLRRQVKGSYGV